MSCSRGAASPDAHTQKRLFAASGGYCQNPGCACELFVDAEGKSVHIAEMAHIFAASGNGPRSNAKMTKAQRGSFDNLILLCANCHTKVDKAPCAYPDTMMFKWKCSHAEKLKAIFGVVKYERRSDARAAIEPLLYENRTIFEHYGPHIDAAVNPESGAAERWQRKMLTRILPNNNRVLAVLDANRALLHGAEKYTLELFRQHIDDLYAYHIEQIKEDASRFPISMTNILED